MPGVVKFYSSLRKFTFALFFSCLDLSHSNPIKREQMKNKFEEFDKNDLILRGRAGNFNRFNWKIWRFGRVLLMPDRQTDNRI